MARAGFRLRGPRCMRAAYTRRGTTSRFGSRKPGLLRVPCQAWVRAQQPCQKVTPVAGEPARGSRVVCTVREGADPDRFSRGCLSTGQERCGCRGVSSHRCQGLSSLGEGSVGTRRLRDVDGVLPDPKGGGRSAGGIDVQASRSRIRRSRLGRVGFFRKFRIVDGSGGRRGGS